MHIEIDQSGKIEKTNVPTVIAFSNHLKEIQHIVIDTEYPGWEHLIKDFLLREIRRIYPHFDPQNIAFTQIGKKSNAHSTGYRVYKKWQPPTRIIKASAILKYLIK